MNLKNKKPKNKIFFYQIKSWNIINEFILVLCKFKRWLFSFDNEYTRMLVDETVGGTTVHSPVAAPLMLNAMTRTFWA